MIDGIQEAGAHLSHWDGRDDAGATLGSGVYFYRFENDDRTETRKMILTR